MTKYIIKTMDTMDQLLLISVNYKNTVLKIQLDFWLGILNFKNAKNLEKDKWRINANIVAP